MTTCSKCNKELTSGAKFCDDCGTQILETLICPNCGMQTSTEFAICQSCGASVHETSAEEQPVAISSEKKKFPKKTFLFIGIGIVVIAVILLALSLFSGNVGSIKKAPTNYALYIKDQEVFYVDLKTDDKPWQLTSRLIDNDDMEEDDLFYRSYTLGEYSYMSENRKYLFFLDKLDDNNYGYNLYYKELNNPEAEAIKIDSNVLNYTVNTSSTLITYLKGEEGNLYQYKIGEDSKDKIASEVESFYVSEDGKIIYYINAENNIYLKYEGKEKEKIASDVSYLEHVTADFTTVYYVKDNTLYKMVEGEGKTKIASDISSVIKIYDTGEIYYLKDQSEELTLLDFVIDDMQDTDAAMIYPEYPDFPTAPRSPSWWSYDTTAEYEAAYDAYRDSYQAWSAECERIRTEYYDACDAYSEKLYRDQLRIDLAEETLSQSIHSLCFYNGSEEIVITDTMAGGYYSNFEYAADAPVISYEAYNQSDLEKIKISEIENYSDVETMVDTALFSTCERYLAVKASSNLIEQKKEIYSFRINDSGTVVYYIDDIPDEKYHGDLYRISINNGVIGKPELYDDNVYTSYCYFVSDNDFQYFKDYVNNKGELYINKNKIDYDVLGYSVEFYPDLDQIFYFTDWNSSKEYGILKIYDNKQATKIADDVYSFTVTPEGRVLYLNDYNIDYYTGELYEWFNGETRHIDDDVVDIIPYATSRYRGYTYGW